jgi:hypothetical protein
MMRAWFPALAAILIVLGLGAASAKERQSTNLAMFCDKYGHSEVAKVVLDPDATTAQKLWAMVWESYSTMSVRCERCPTFIVLAAIVLAWVGLVGAYYVTLRIIKQFASILAPLAAEWVRWRVARKLEHYGPDAMRSALHEAVRAAQPDPNRDVNDRLRDEAAKLFRDGKP